MERAADPYRDTSVIDARAPRFNQAVVGLVSLVAVTVGPWWLLALLAAQLVVGLTLGRRYCLPCLAYFELSWATGSPAGSSCRARFRRNRHRLRGASEQLPSAGCEKDEPRDREND